jgi:diguanylate cyclase (GGDEF)-like protein
VTGSSPLSEIAALRGALEAARGVRSRDDLVFALDRIAAVISEGLDYRSVAINLHRPAWDDFEATTVHGPDATRQAMLGKTSSWEHWAPSLAARFERSGAHDVPDDGQLLAVMRAGNGDVLGIIAVQEPVDERRPTDDDCDRLVALAQIAALAVEQAADAERDAGHRSALDRLLSLSLLTGEQRRRAGVLQAVCTGICETLGFQRSAVLLAENGGLLRPAATAGWTMHDPVFAHLAFTPAQFEPILTPAYERHGCHLLTREDAESTLNMQASIYRSQANGRGPYAWERHWLVVGLRDDAGALRGIVWADDPTDRLIPGRERLQILRLFADRAAGALDASREGEKLPAPFADYDPLTGLANRAKLAERLRHALQRTKRAETTVAVLFIDLDNFHHTNESLGHHAGDELLRISAARIDEDLRPGDTVARFGGDEFVALCEDVGSAAEAMDVAERLRILLAEPIPLATGVAQVTASIGVALPDRPDRSAEALLQAADRAMYEAKAAGRDAARLATPGAGWP